MIINLKVVNYFYFKTFVSNPQLQIPVGRMVGFLVGVLDEVLVGFFVGELVIICVGAGVKDSGAKIKIQTRYFI